MNTIIFYFTGTGNSKAVADQLKEQMINQGMTVSIEAIKKDTGLIDLNQYESIGFVYPVYYLHMPNLVNSFISSLDYKASHYLFAIATYAGSLGRSLSQAKDIMIANGGEKIYHEAIRMPGNYIVEYGAFPTFLQNYLLRKSEIKIQKVSNQLLVQRLSPFKRESLVSKLFHNKAKEKLNSFNKMSLNFVVNDTCTACSKCINQCPADNIRLSSSQVVFSNQCEQCMACIQLCPNRSIEYFGKTENRKRYHHPLYK